MFNLMKICNKGLARKIVFISVLNGLLKPPSGLKAQFNQDFTRYDIFFYQLQVLHFF